MSSRYIINTFALVAGVVALVISRSFAAGALEWTAFGVGAAVLVAAVIGLATATQRRHLLGYSVLGTVAAWSAVAALVFAAPVLGWLVLADAIAVAAIALGALSVHEVTTERVVHTLEVRDEALELQTI